MWVLVQVPSEVLEWPFRAPAILDEILEADADIIALQELNHYGVHNISSTKAPETNLIEVHVDKFLCLSSS